MYELQKTSGVSLEKLTSLWEVTLDSPTADFYAEMSELYPDSVVILTTRDADEQWWASWYNTLGVFFGSDLRGSLLRLLLWTDWRSGARNEMISNYTSLWRSKYGSYGPDIHRAHNLEVRKRTDPNRLLVFNVKEGWAPLCRFLQVEVPARPFPRMLVSSFDLKSLSQANLLDSNDLPTFNDRHQKLLRECALRWLLIISVPLACSIAAYLMLRSP